MNRFKIFTAYCVAVLLCSSSLAQTQGNLLTLRECVETAITNNIDVKQSDLQMQREAIGWRQSKADLLPTVRGNIDHTMNQGRSIDLYTNSYINQQYNSASYSLNGNVTLFNGLRLLNTLKSNQFAYEASRMEWQQAKDNLTLDVILAYLQILNNTELLAQVINQADVSRQQVERLEIMNQQGAIPPSDLSDLKGQLAQNNVSVINSRNNLETAKLNLSQLMNIPYDSNMTVEKLPLEQFDMTYASSPDSIYQAAMEQLAMVKATELRTKSAEKSVQAARGSLFPTIGLGGGIYTNFSSTARDTAAAKIPYYDQLSNNYSTGVGIGISIPILTGFRSRNQVKLAKINLKSAEYIKQNTHIQLKQSIERDYLNMAAARNRYRALAEQVAAYTESFRAAEVRFNAGLGTSIDYLTAKNFLDQANANLITARYEYVLRTRILDYYQGRQMW